MPESGKKRINLKNDMFQLHNFYVTMRLRLNYTTNVCVLNKTNRWGKCIACNVTPLCQKLDLSRSVPVESMGLRNTYLAHGMNIKQIRSLNKNIQWPSKHGGNDNSCSITFLLSSFSNMNFNRLDRVRCPNFEIPSLKCNRIFGFRRSKMFNAL